MADDDWRIGTNAGDFFGRREKIADIEKRRPSIRRPSDLVGPGIAANTVRVTNWNDVLTTFNGYYSSLPGALGAPNMVENFAGFVVSDSEMGGTQHVTGMASGREYKRVFRRAPADPEFLAFEGWMPTNPTIQFATSVVSMFNAGRVTFPMPYPEGVVPVVTLTGGNNEILSFLYGTIAQPDRTGFGFLAYDQNGNQITSGPVRVCWTAVG